MTLSRKTLIYPPLFLCRLKPPSKKPVRSSNAGLPAVEAFFESTMCYSMIFYTRDTRTQQVFFAEYILPGWVSLLCLIAVIRSHDIASIGGPLRALSCCSRCSLHKTLQVFVENGGVCLYTGRRFRAAVLVVSRSAGKPGRRNHSLASISLRETVVGNRLQWITRKTIRSSPPYARTQVESQFTYQTILAIDYKMSRVA